MADNDTSNAQNKNNNGISASEIDRQVDYCQTNLKILAQIKVGDKLCFDTDTNKFCIDEWSWSQPMVRWWGSEGRKPTIKAIEDFITQVFKTIDSVYSSEVTETYVDVKNTYYTNIASTNAVFQEANSTILMGFINEIRNAIGGIGNLKQTYASDVATISSLDIAIEKLNVRVKKIQGILKISKD
tara:strand:+ start:2205 stop:2759 length:555 start_codon:yes stop_codon:yes gene_type:complete